MCDKDTSPTPEELFPDWPPKASLAPIRSGQLAAMALALGLAGNLLIYPAWLGAGASFWALVVLAITGWLHNRAEPAGPRRMAALYALAGLSALCLAWRDATFLRCGSLALYLFTIGWIHLSGAGISLRNLPVLMFFFHYGGLFLSWLVAPFLHVSAIHRETPEVPRSKLMPALRGVVIALLMLVLFGSLLSKADIRFSALVNQLFAPDWPGLLRNTFWTMTFTFVAMALLTRRGQLWGPWQSDMESLRDRMQRGGHTMVALELLIPMVALDLLFAVFVYMQLGYFFGGEAYVQQQMGVTYAEYARKGFFELATVAALIVPLQLVFDAWLSKESPENRRRFQCLAAIQGVLLLFILASAAHRMALYQDAYGLTRLRFYASAGIVWIGLTIIWHMLTVLRDRRNAFVFGALMSAIALFLVVQALNPEAMIARINLARMAGSSAGAAPETRHDNEKNPSRWTLVDMNYLGLLSVDAVPVIEDALNKAPERDKPALRQLVNRLRKKQPDPGWRTWSWSRWRAGRATSQSPAASTQRSIQPQKVYSGGGGASVGRQARLAGSR